VRRLASLIPVPKEFSALVPCAPCLLAGDAWYNPFLAGQTGFRDGIRTDLLGSRHPSIKRSITIIIHG
jgi:hypothetical protein